MTNFAGIERVVVAVGALLLGACNAGGASAASAGDSPDGGDDSSAGDLWADSSNDWLTGLDAEVFVTAKHPALPQVVSYGGPVLTSPKIQPIAYFSDEGLADMNAFLQELEHGRYWTETTAEYGVGPVTVLPTITLNETPPPTISDAALAASLAANTSGPFPAWGLADSSTIYLFVLPKNSMESDSEGACCSGYDGYHSETTSGSVPVAYAVSCACPGFDGPSIADIQERTVNASHELVESATEPFPYTDPAWGREDDADIVWTLATVGEVGDMCEFNNDAYYVPPGATYMIQRTWSNAAAKRLMNPCAPISSPGPYFNAAPSLQPMTYPLPGGGSIQTRGLSIPMGQTKTVDVTLFSLGPMPGPWRVTAYDYGYLLGGPANLELSLDQRSGQNGDTLHLSIKVRSRNGSIGGEAFVLYSEYGAPGDAVYQNNLSMALVLN
jgi:hypothetical protein